MKFAYLIEPPFNHKTPTGEVTGTDVELAKIICTRLGLGEFEPIEAEFAELLPGVASGRWRMTTGLFATKDRKKLALFSNPIWALPDGFLVQAGNPMAITGYRSIAALSSCTVAVIRDQFQHRSAVDFGIAEENLRVFETYTDAANAVLSGEAHAYASVGRAHTGFINLRKEHRLEVITVPFSEKLPAFGSFAYNKQDHQLHQQVNRILESFLGSDQHRTMMHSFGFIDAEIDLIVDASA